MVISKDNQAIQTVADWFRIAPPKGGKDQWVPGRSAYECARAWCSNATEPSVPSELSALLKSCSSTKDATITAVFPERRIRFDKLAGEPRNSDLAILAKYEEGCLAINIEAKADEPFDRYVRDVLMDGARRIAADIPTNLVARVQGLARSIFSRPLNGASALGNLRYQLLTGIAGTISFALETGASRGLFVIHEFVTDFTDDSKHEMNKRDLDAFVFRLTQGRRSTLPAGAIIGPIAIPGTPLFQTSIPLFIGKVVRNLRTNR